MSFAVCREREGETQASAKPRLSRNLQIIRRMLRQVRVAATTAVFGKRRRLRISPRDERHCCCVSLCRGVEGDLMISAKPRQPRHRSVLANVWSGRCARLQMSPFLASTGVSRRSSVSTSGTEVVRMCHGVRWVVDTRYTGGYSRFFDTKNPKSGRAE